MASGKPQNIHNEETATRLAMFRKEYINKSQNLASKKLNIPQSALSYMESGKAPIRYEFVRKLVEDYQLNQNWLLNGNGTPVDEDPPKGTLLTDINALNLQIERLKKGIQMLEANQNYMRKRMTQMEEELAKKSTK